MLEVDRDGQRYRQEYAKGGKPQGKLEVVGADARARPHLGHDGHVLARSDDLRGRGHRVRRPHRARAPADDGVPQPWPRDRVRRRARREGAARSPTSTRAASSTSSSTSTPRRRRCSPRSARSRTTTTTARRSTSRSSGTPATTRASTATPTASPPPRAACTSRASAPRSRSVVNKYARAKNLLKEKDENLLGEDIREGITAIVSVKLRDPQFEGQTKAKLGNVPMRSFVQKGHQRAPRRVARGEPDRGQPGRQEGAGRGPGARRGEERPQRHPPQDGAVGRRHARQAEGLLVAAIAAESELFIVEGDSAGGTAARRPRPAHPGDPADPRQDPQRRAGPRSTRC